MALIGGVAAVTAPPAEAHFLDCNAGSGFDFAKWPSESATFSRPASWQSWVRAGVDNAAISINSNTDMTLTRITSGGNIPITGAAWGPGGLSGLTTMIGNSNCDITSAPITLNTSLFPVYSGDKMQSLAIHEFGHATGQTRSGGGSEVNDQCQLRTIMQQHDDCRWDAKGIKSLTETHDLNDYFTVYGAQ